MITLDDIARALSGHTPQLIAGEGLTRAAVALLLRDGAHGPEVLFIERAARDGDPWSGDLGFPGGKVEEDDPSPQGAAERETMEEIGLDLGTARCLGRLSDIVGAHLPVRVSCFAYAADDAGELRLSEEVRDAFWVPLSELLAPQRHVTAAVRFGGETFERPAIRLPQPGMPLLWGITYRLIMQLLDLLEKVGEPDSGASTESPENR